MFFACIVQQVFFIGDGRTSDTGLFLYHFHNLEHGDLGMMRNFYVS